ncbi:MAG: GtrA family protein [Lentisphaeria bacterium]|nr:GtrA family protein [Lentisphaeria bacterium]
MNKVQIPSYWRVLILKFSGFSLVGASVTLVSIVLLFLLNDVCGWNAYLSYCTSYLLTLLLSYWLNSRFVFQSAMSLRKLAGYFVSYLSGMLLGTGILAILIAGLPGGNRTLLSCAVIPVTMLWNFILIDRILTRHRKAGEV